MESSCAPCLMVSPDDSRANRLTFATARVYVVTLPSRQRMFRTASGWRRGALRALGSRPVAVSTLAVLMFAGAHALSAQNSTRPTLPISGPQGIGIRVEPIPADAPRFEAASIRRDQSGTMPPSSQGQMVFFRGNRLTATTITARELIRNGYNLQHVPRSFVVEGPDWIDSERWNVEA